MAGRRILTEDEYPLPANPKAADVASAVADILRHQYVQKIVIRAGQPIKVSWHKKEGESLFYRSVESFTDILQRLDLADPSVRFEASGDPCEDLIRAYTQLQKTGLCVRFAVVSPNTRMRRWLGFPASYPLHNQLLGADIMLSDEVGDTAMILLAAKTKTAVLVDTTAGLKLTMRGS